MMILEEQQRRPSQLIEYSMHDYRSEIQEQVKKRLEKKKKQVYLQPLKKKM